MWGGCLRPTGRSRFRWARVIGCVVRLLRVNDGLFPTEQTNVPQEHIRTMGDLSSLSCISWGTYWVCCSNIFEVTSSLSSVNELRHWAAMDCTFSGGASAVGFKRPIRKGTTISVFEMALRACSLSSLRTFVHHHPQQPRRGHYLRHLIRPTMLSVNNHTL